MPDASAISLDGVSKVYKLYPSPVALALDTLGLYRLRPGGAPAFPEHPALRGISLEIGRGERVGVIGRNGAGKTTLLRLISGIAAPSAGRVRVAGRVQALMDTGLGFHPEFTGMEGIRASLLFNGLDEAQTADAVADVVEFAELGEFLQQPLKTYSLGMRARLGFAAATAVRPDVLIIDEALGAGDAYFQSKCAARMRGLTAGGTTLLLVSHSTEQIVQFCDRAIWLDRGEIVASGESIEVVKAYDAFVRELDDRRLRGENAAGAQRARTRTLSPEAPGGAPGHANLQRSLSRWTGVPGLKIRAVDLVDAGRRPQAVFATGSRLEFRIRYAAEQDGDFECTLVILVFTLDGKPLSLHCSDRLRLRLRAGEEREAALVYDNILFGNGDYVVSVAIYETLDLANPDAAVIYDLLDRSFQFRVYDEHARDQTLLRHPARWTDPR